MCLPLETLILVELTYSGGTDRPGELCYNVKQPYQIVIFPTRIPECDFHSPASICSTMALPPLEIFFSPLSGFNITTIHESQDCTGSGRASL